MLSLSPLRHGNSPDVRMAHCLWQHESAFDLLNSKLVHGLLEWWASILPILGFLCLSVVELGRGTRQTDRQTDTGPHFICPLLTEVGHDNNNNFSLNYTYSFAKCRLGYTGQDDLRVKSSIVNELRTFRQWTFRPSPFGLERFGQIQPL